MNRFVTPYLSLGDGIRTPVQTISEKRSVAGPKVTPQVSPSVTGPGPHPPPKLGPRIIYIPGVDTPQSRIPVPSFLVQARHATLCTQATAASASSTRHKATPEMHHMLMLVLKVPCRPDNLPTALTTSIVDYTMATTVCCLLMLLLLLLLLP